MKPAGPLVRAGSAAGAKLAGLLPHLSPWQQFALWHGLVDAQVPAEPPTETDVMSIIEQRLAPLVLLALADSQVEVDAGLMTRLRDSAFYWTASTHAVTAAGVDTVGLLSAAGFSIAVSKGPGIAALYPARGTRPFADLDVIAGPADFAGIVSLLQSRGWAESARNAQPWAYFNRYCREGLNLERQVAESVDVHHHIPPWIWSQGIALDEVIAAAQPVAVAGSETPLPCLSPEDNLLVACLHVVSDKNKPGKTLMIWRDLAVLSARADPEVFASLASKRGLAGWVRTTLTALPEQLRPWDLVRRLPDEAVPHARRLSALLVEDSRRSVVRSQLLRLPALNGLAFAAGMARPSPSFLRNKYPGAQARYRAWLRSPTVLNGEE